MKFPALFPAAVLALASCGGAPEPARRPAAADPVEVPAERMVLAESASEITLVGSVRAKAAVTVASKMLGYIRTVGAAEGQRVRAGQTLVELDDEDPRAALAGAEAARAGAESAIAAARQSLSAARAEQELAEATHHRYSTLLATQSATQQEFDQAQARLTGSRANVEAANARIAEAESRRAQAEAQIERARAALSYARIVSPVDGIVTRRLADPGSLASPGAPLLEIEPSGSYRLEAAVPESQSSRLQSGQQLRVSIDALSGAGPPAGRIVEIVPQVEPGSRTFLVKIELPPHAGLRSGLFGRAYLPGPVREELTVPAAAVVQRGQMRSVFVIEDGRARLRLVTLGAARDGRYAVLSGLRVGDAVALDPAQLTDGLPAAARVSEVRP